jgi:hypothetical protein
MPISRMQNPRQLYGLGSLVRSITRPVKKIFKSPIGKAAMLGLGAYGLGGGFGAGGFKFGNIPGFTAGKNFLFGNVGGPANMYGKKGIFSKMAGAFGKGSIGKGAMALGLGGGLASMMAKQPEEEEEEYIDRIRSMTPYLKRYYKQANPLASDEDVEEFVSDNTVEYSKDGGMIGYQEGGPVDEDVIMDQETVTEDVETPDGMDKLKETLTEVAKVLYRVTPVGAAMFTFDEAKKLYEGLPDISKEMIHSIGKGLSKMSPMGAASAGAKGLATLLKGGIEQGQAQDMMGQREKVVSAPSPQAELNDASMNVFGKSLQELTPAEYDQLIDLINDTTSSPDAPDITTRQQAAEGGLMNFGGYEKDYRMGGFVPMGKKEKADDVPARLSKNEFVFTADAVKAAGGGSVDKGAQKMYDTMKTLEKRMA